MAETLSPNPTSAQRYRSVAGRIQSPLSPFFLGSNDDDLERAQARAARAAAIRRKSMAAHAVPVQQDAEPCLGKQQILELLQNCIKLASENKINQKNTWELGLIDHLYEIIKVEEESDAETNFQKASCTLEAGVKIYSLRVDSVHSEAYKVLGGINRAGQVDEPDDVEDGPVGGGHEEGHQKKETDRKLSPLSTLESSFEALNLKKLDVAFAVDPLYHQTSAQFDEGGAKGLLLNNLGVFGKCAVLFDSMEVPGKCIPCNSQQDKSETVDLSFAKENAEQMVTNMRMKAEISPTLCTIVSQFDEDNRRPTEATSSLEETEGQEDTVLPNGGEFVADSFDNGSNWDFHQYDDADVGDGDTSFGDPAVPSHIEENENLGFRGPETEDESEEVEGYLFLSLGMNTKQNAWAGPDHWKYRKPKGLEEKQAPENGSTVTSKKPRNKKQAEPELDFTASLDKDWTHIFAPPKNPKSLLLPANRVPCNTKLPEDCHYQPEDLVKLFLLPKVMCLGRRRRKKSDGLGQPCDDYGPSTSWDGESVFGGPFDDGNDHSDAEDGLDTLVSQPRQVNKIEVQYDKTSKQVDVQALKETLWDHTQRTFDTSVQGLEDGVSFKQILASFPADCRAAATGDVSPHLCFICLLHLANEHGLTINGCPNLDDLSIHLHRPVTTTSNHG
ncbi:condensin complex subunit 2 isoform X2 [Punica granatum]|uniref:Condensin complex subunit 2 n=1 Tax=Punica granatum TaxID=22663 RepID=A0A6P8DDY4_PUNGR|nr:condensin complex subunit 2 isoform X2 [Punica granatum]